MFAGIPVEDEAARALADGVRGLHGAFRSVRNQVIAAAGLHVSEFDALVIIGEAQGLVAKNLAAAIGLTNSATTALVDRLCALGLLRRERHPSDRRSVIVSLAPAGESLLTAVYRDHVSRFVPIVNEDFSTGEHLSALVSALHQVTEALHRVSVRAAAAPALTA